MGDGGGCLSAAAHLSAGPGDAVYSVDLINERFDLARIEAGQLAYFLEPVSVREITPEAADLVAPLAATRGIQLKIEAAGAPDWFVLADRQRFKQVLLNLLSAAVKYSRAGGAVTLAYEYVRRGRVRINVSGTRPGIPPETLERLFTPIDRLGAGQTGEEGAGLGLVLSKRLVWAGHLAREAP